MKTPLSVLLLSLMSMTAAAADVCVKQNSHTDGYYYGSVTCPPEDEESVVWIGADRMAVVSEDRSVTVDVKAKLMYFINNSDSTYAEIALPIDWSGVVDEQLLGRLQMESIPSPKVTRRRNN